MLPGTALPGAALPGAAPAALPAAASTSAAARPVSRPPPRARSPAPGTLSITPATLPQPARLNQWQKRQLPTDSCHLSAETPAAHRAQAPPTHTPGAGDADSHST
jgi:hypothetical protein